MEKVFYELVIEGHVPVIKGFIFGLLEGSKRTGTVIVSRENNIKTETLGEVFMEWTHLHESLCHVVIEEDFLNVIKNGLEKTFHVLKLKLKEVRKIKKASFHFQYEVYAKKYGEEIKNIFKELPSQLKTSPDYQPKEESDTECTDIGSLASCHGYTLKAHGSVEGPIDVLLFFYKKIQEFELIKENSIALHFEN
ncbi:MAG: hypothetical protein OS130_13220 [Thermodesulfobacteriota bacterium]|jgi:hypothetical protein|nr:MAG: hypothetical protein OS130_13220 [Thermodesulfobacteriota bacterium]